MKKYKYEFEQSSHSKAFEIIPVQNPISLVKIFGYKIHCYICNICKDFIEIPKSQRLKCGGNLNISHECKTECQSAIQMSVMGQHSQSDATMKTAHSSSHDTELSPSDQMNDHSSHFESISGSSNGINIEMGGESIASTSKSNQLELQTELHTQSHAELHFESNNTQFDVTMKPDECHYVENCTLDSQNENFDSNSEFDIEMELVNESWPTIENEVVEQEDTLEKSNSFLSRSIFRKIS